AGAPTAADAAAAATTTSESAAMTRAFIDDLREALPGIGLDQFATEADTCTFSGVLSRPLVPGLTPCPDDLAQEGRIGEERRCAPGRAGTDQVSGGCCRARPQRRAARAR